MLYRNLAQEQEHALMAAEVAIAYTPPVTEFTVSSPIQAVDVFTQIWGKELYDIQKEFFAVFLDSRFNVLCWRHLGRGDRKRAMIDKSMIATIACTTLSDYVITANNSPNGDIKPSEWDKEQIASLSYLLDWTSGIQLIDHIIMGGRKYYSFTRDKRLPVTLGYS